MLRNYLKTAYRILSRNKMYSLINIAGLSIGVTLFIIISLFIHGEVSHDRFNEHYENIYRLNKDDWGILGTAYGPEAKDNFPEIKEFVRFSLHNFSNPLVSVGENQFNKRMENFSAIFKEKFNQDQEMNFYMVPLSDIYFDTSSKYEININHGNLKFIYIFIAIALFIVVIAAINFINLTTARAAGRAKEVGLRKVIGSNKKQLVLQFLGESILVSLMAFLLGLVLVETLMPVFNNLFYGTISNHYYHEPFFWIVYFSGIVLLGLVSGLYPAFYLTRFNPVSVIKGEPTRGKNGGGFRKTLTVFQFFISVILIIGTITIYQQVKFMKNKDLGFNRNHQVYFTLTREMASKKEAFKTELLNAPGVKSVTYTSQPAGRITWQESWKINGVPKQFTYQPIDPDYLHVMGLKIARGENFAWEKPSFKDRRGVLLNEEAVKFFGLKDPVGKTIHTHVSYWEDVHVVGVVEDFHYNSLHDKIAPLVMAWDERGRTANLLLEGKDIPATISYLTNTWEKFAQGYPFEFHFLDQALDRQYKDDERFGRLFTCFAVFAVLIACLGLYGLSLYAVQYRKREIGIRKANGASMESIARMFIKDFGLTVLIANIIAWPVAYYLMDKWLQNFPYRVEVDPWTFFVALVVSVLVAVATVFTNTLKAAGTNPAITLKDE